MKAIGFNRPLPAEHPDALLDIELPEPSLNPNDLLIEVQAISVNPADVKVRAAHHHWQEPVERLLAAASQHGVRVTTPMIGEVFTLDDPPAGAWWRGLR